jgi:hypothetical protein
MNALGTTWLFSSDKATDALSKRHTFLNALTCGVASPFDEFAAALVFGELVTNVVRHAPGRIEVSLQNTGIMAVLTVRDGGPGFVYNPLLPTDLSHQHGRGLFLVFSYAASVSCLPRDGSGMSGVRALLALRD